VHGARERRPHPELAEVADRPSVEAARGGEVAVGRGRVAQVHGHLGRLPAEPEAAVRGPGPQVVIAGRLVIATVG